MAKQKTKRAREDSGTQVPQPINLRGRLVMAEQAAAYASQLAQAGQIDEAMAVCEQVLRQQPRQAHAAYVLGSLLLKVGRPEAARTWLEIAARAAGDSLSVQLTLLSCLQACDDSKAQEQLLRHLLSRFPSSFDVIFALATLCMRQERYTEAEQLYRRAIEAAPQHASSPWVALGVLLGKRAAFDEAYAAFESAVACAPHNPDAWQNLLFLSSFSSTLTPAQIFALHQQLTAPLETLHQQNWRPHANSPDANRPLKIGFVSGDLHAHPIGYFMQALLAELDTGALQTTVYSSNIEDDAVTATLRAHATTWRDVRDASDAQLLEQIRADAIDILIDLSGLTAKNRILTLACKPAPVQVSYLGYFASTGLPSMDYILANRDLIPDEETALYSEKPWYLPDSYLCYTPHPHAPVPLAPPALANGHITFGSFCKLIKLNDAVLDTWASILAATPGSRLFLKFSNAYDQSVLDGVTNTFVARGIAKERLRIEDVTSHADYLAAYNDIDITLDTFPYNGGTTTTDSLWMGVPVISVHGDRYVAHMAEAILKQVDLADWVARDRQSYIDLAISKAGQLEALTQLRATLRQRMQQSPLCDAPRFARNFATALRGMWQRWCKEQTRKA